ncbi:hypothetical protein [Streptomyces sp. NPDC015125]|uniref:hypothetical protein n=1 Tax=Streptomyces sp. NPDC015125 TaxID=3364938 RepID=UPI0036F85648
MTTPESTAAQKAAALFVNAFEEHRSLSPDRITVAVRTTTGTTSATAEFDPDRYTYCFHPDAVRTTVHHIVMALTRSTPNTWITTTHPEHGKEINDDVGTAWEITPAHARPLTAAEVHLRHPDLATIDFDHSARFHQTFGGDPTLRYALRIPEIATHPETVEVLRGFGLRVCQEWDESQLND